MPKSKDAIRLELLLLRSKRGDQQALTELIGTWERRLFFYIRRIVATEEDAWDVLQQTWLKVFSGIKGLAHAENLPTWLYKIARLTAMSHWRSYYREQSHRAAKAQEIDVAEYEEHLDFENAEEVAMALSLISLDHREVLTLYFLDDLSLDEIADVLAIPVGTVKSRLCYAKRSLRAALEQEDHKYV